MAWITAENVKAAMGITHADEDTRIEAAITRAAGVMEAIMGRSWEVTERTEVHNGGEAIFVRSIPITDGPTVLDLWQDGEPEVSVKTEPSAGIIWFSAFGTPFAPGSGRFSVTYTGGVDALPSDLKAALIECAASYVALADGIATEKDGDFQATRGGLDPDFGIPASALTIFKRYRLPS